MHKFLVKTSMYMALFPAFTIQSLKVHWENKTLQSMLRKYCLESEKSWDEGIPHVFFAALEAVQE